MEHECEEKECGRNKMENIFQNATKISRMELIMEMDEWLKIEVEDSELKKMLLKEWLLRKLIWEENNT